METYRESTGDPVSRPGQQLPGEVAATAISPLIELVAVSVAAKNHPGAAILEGVHWRIEPGQWWVVGGLPGSGRTQLLFTVAGLCRPLSGAHRVFGHDLATLDETRQRECRRRVGVVFEEGGRLFHHLNVIQNVAIPFCYHHNMTVEEAADRVGEWLEIMELSGVAERFPSQLTVALRQRVGLARALILQPDVLLIDNPLGVLDARQSYRWIELMQAVVEGKHPRLEHAVTLVVMTGNLWPWRDHGRQFALIRQNRWLSLGGRVELTARDEPWFKEFFAGG
jgi:putative spermidine/putrescine transport system ATP-binding protein